jgi:hypothetical protein
MMQRLMHRRANSGLDLDDDAAAKSFLYPEDFNVYAPPFSLKGKIVLDFQEQFEKVGFRALTAPDDMLGICIMANWPSSKPANGAKDNDKRL